MQSFSTPNDLVEALKSINSEKNNDTPKNYRYVIYVRKSTDEKDKQIRSLSDQIAECKEFADKNNLKYDIQIVSEAESAKEPDIRPKFRQMLNDLTAGKYDGIIAWHPDRLARNMKDAGEIIDLVDKEIIKDLKFVSFTFQNDTSGKMLLGITFVLSKEYSDKLSDNVSRGNKRSIEEGKYINKAKHGYIKDKNQMLRPDGNNFILIKKAFMMRLIEHKTLDEIAEYLNSNGYYRSNIKDGKKHYKINKQKVEKFLRDPIYTGVLQYGKNDAVNLMELYNFIPMVSVQEFMEINKLNKGSQLIKLAKSYRKDEDVKANLMRGMIICANCGESMSAGITIKKNPKNNNITRYFYYRCETDDCIKYGKSVRAKEIVNYVSNFLEKKPFSSKKSYASYVKEINKVSEQRIIDMKSTLISLQTKKRHILDKKAQLKAMLLSDLGEESKLLFKSDIEINETQLKETDENIEKTENFINSSKTSILTYSDFLELMEEMPKNIGLIKNMEELDYVIKKIFLNFTIKDKKVDKHTLNSPFDELDTSKVSLGAR